MQQLKKIISVPIANDADSRRRLDLAFRLPEIVAEILSGATTPISNIVQAKLLLLTKWKEINSAISFRDNKDQAIDALSDFASNWLSSSHAISRISFPSNCTISNDSKNIWLPELFLLPVADSALLAAKRSSWRRYDSNFDLNKTIDGRYFVQIQVHLKKNDSQQKNSEDVYFGKGVGASLLKLLDWKAREIDKISRNFSSSDYEMLSGKPVQGGSPGLGKRS